MKKYLLLFFTTMLIACQNENIYDFGNNYSFTDEEFTQTSDNETSVYLQFYDSIKNIENWKKYHSFEERIAACQIDNKIVKTLKTETLVKLLFNNPMHATYIAYDNQFCGIESILERDNVFKELLKREDSAHSILDAYEEMFNEVYCQLEKEPKSFNFLTNLAFMELTIAHGDFLELYKGELVDKLSRIVENFISIKNVYVEYFSFETLKNSLLIKKRIEFNGTIENDLLWSIVRRETLYDQDFNEIKSRLGRIPDREVIGHGIVFTKFGQCIEYDINEELTSSEINELTSRMAADYPNAILLGNSTYSYNALGYAWHMESHPNSPVWINKYDSYGDENISKYYTNDYYCEGTASSHWIVMYDNNHKAAIKSGEDGYYISKWSMGPLMKHTINDCPFPTNNKSYYKVINMGGALTASYGFGSTTVETPGNYSIASNAFIPIGPFLTYSWYIEDARGDEITPAKATVSYGNTGCTITFHQTGLYDIYLRVGLNDGTYLGTYSYQAIVLNDYGSF